jgi:hypothetical protein
VLDNASDNGSDNGPASKRQRRAAETLSRDGGAGSGTDEHLHQLFTEVMTAGKASCSAVLAHLQSAEKGRLSGTSKSFQELLSKPAVWSEVQLSTQAVPHWRKFKAYKRRDGSVMAAWQCRRCAHSTLCLLACAQRSLDSQGEGHDTLCA